MRARTGTFAEEHFDERVRLRRAVPALVCKKAAIAERPQQIVQPRALARARELHVDARPEIDGFLDPPARASPHGVRRRVRQYVKIDAAHARPAHLLSK